MLFFGIFLGLLALGAGYLLGRHRSVSKTLLTLEESSCVASGAVQSPPRHLQPSMPLMMVPDLPPSVLIVSQAMALFDAMPFLIWAKNNRHTTVYRNKAYETFENHVLLKERLDAPVFPVSQEIPLLEKIQKTGKECRARLGRSVGGQLFTFDAWGMKDEGGNTWVFAYDLSEYEREQEALKKAFHQFEGTFNHFPLGIAIWGKNQRLKKFNSRFASFFQLDTKWLARHPLLEELLEHLRHQRMVPEVIDFAAYKRHFQSFFQGVRRPQEEMLHLPDERTFRFLATSYADGGSLWMFEDLTEPLTLKRLHNGIVSVSEAVSHHMREGILLLSVDRKVILINPICAEWWGIDRSTITNKNFSELLEACRPYVYYRHYFSLYKNYIINCMLKRSPYKDVIYRQDGLLLQFEYVPLPNGDHLLKFMDVTETHKAKETLNEARRLLAVDQYLFSRRIQHLKLTLLEDALGNELTPSPPTALTHSPALRSKILEQIRYVQLSLGGDRPMVRERLSFQSIFEDLLDVFHPLIEEKRLTISFSSLENSLLISNKTLLIRFLSRLIGVGLNEATVQSHVTFSMRARGERIFLVCSFQVQKNRSFLSTWYHPWDLGFSLLKEMASLSGAILSISTSHPSRLRLVCVFPHHLRFYEAMPPMGPSMPSINQPSKQGKPLVVEYSK